MDSCVTAPIDEAPSAPQSETPLAPASTSVADPKPSVAATECSSARRSLSQYLQPGESSPEQVRQRLHTALAQTRMLRHTFTERLYDKYRVVLKPVPASAQDMIQTISARPQWVQAELIKRMNYTCHEKDAEKREAQELNAEMAAAQAAGHVLPLLRNLTDVDHAEQLSWISSGLSLVILPEDDSVSAAELAARGIHERGPFDAHTGHKVDHISLAAATAGQGILERVRKGAWLRMERKRKRDQLPSTGDTTFRDESSLHYPSPEIPHTHLRLTTPTSTSKAESMGGPQQLPLFAEKGMKIHKKAVQRISQTTLTKKQKTTPNLLLSLSPKDEMVGVQDGTWNTATHALLTHPRAHGQDSNKPYTESTDTPTPTPQADQAIQAIFKSFMCIDHGLSTDSSQIHTACPISDSDTYTVPHPPTTHEKLYSSSMDPHLVLSVLYAIGILVDRDKGHGNTSSLQNIIHKSRIITNTIEDPIHTSTLDFTKKHLPFTHIRISKQIIQRCAEICQYLPNTMEPDTETISSHNGILTVDPESNLNHDSNPPAPSSIEHDPTVPQDYTGPIPISTQPLKHLLESTISSATTEEKIGEHQDSLDTIQPTIFAMSVDDQGPSLVNHPLNQGTENDPPATIHPFDYSRPNHTHATTTTTAVGPAIPYPFQKTSNTDYLQTNPMSTFLYANPNYLHSLPYATGLSPYQLAQLPTISPNSFISPKLPTTPIVSNSTQNSSHTSFPCPANVSTWSTKGYLTHFSGPLASQPSTSSIPLNPVNPTSLNNLPWVGSLNTQLGPNTSVSSSTGVSLPSQFGTTPLVHLPVGNKETNINDSPCDTTGHSEKEFETCQDPNPTCTMNDARTGNIHVQKEGDNPCEKGSGVQESTSGHTAVPNGISPVQADLITHGLFHSVMPEKLGSDESLNLSLLQYLDAAGDTVPIAKDVIDSMLKERLKSFPGGKISCGVNSMSYPSLALQCNVANSIIRLWLWAKHRVVFESALKKYTRIEDNQECSSLIYLAVDFAALSIPPTTTNEPDKNIGTKSFCTNAKSVIQLIRLACQISKRLNECLSVDPVLDEILPNINFLISFIKHQRAFALKTISRERALLASFVSRNIRMSEMFSHSYTSAMIRAGEVLGYNVLCEITRDEKTGTSTMLPFDIHIDLCGSWEDPCRSFFTKSCNEVGEQLTRRAHARALITKSLRKLQDRYNIIGGTAHEGPYCEFSSSDGTPCMKRSASISFPLKTNVPLLNRSSSSLKRKSSFCSTSDVTTGVSSSVPTLFNSNCYSSPYFVDMDENENRPYGRYAIDDYAKPSMDSRPALLSHASKRPHLDSEQNDLLLTRRGTYEIEWADIANLFQTTAAANNSVEKLLIPRALSFQGDLMFNPGSTIFAPYCRRVESSLKHAAVEGESDTEEEISEGRLLESHQIVLDKMKEKLDAIMAIRRKYQDRTRKRP